MPPSHSQHPKSLWCPFGSTPQEVRGQESLGLWSLEHNLPPPPPPTSPTPLAPNRTDTSVQHASSHQLEPFGLKELDFVLFNKQEKHTLMVQAQDRTDSFRCSSKSFGNHSFLLPCVPGLDLRLTSCWRLRGSPAAMTCQGQSQCRKQGVPCL